MHSNTFLQEYLHVLTDPGHLLAEITFVVVVDILLLGLLVPLIRRSWKRRLDHLHKELDIEHDVDHEAVTSSPLARREKPSLKDLERMRASGTDEWLIRMLKEHYRI